MVIHYSASNEHVACGRTGSRLHSSREQAQVSCKLCLRVIEKGANEPVRKTPSLAELRAAAKAAKASAEVAKPAAVLTPRAEWQKRLEQLPGRNRLPRGISRQTFI
ncbi:hypothetical protein [Pseudomonas sp.]|uniref:hypothetical protein n=1 Tax=Pseudomonas sp. TaxID=306 RepID=UPI003D0C3EB7